MTSLPHLPLSIDVESKVVLRASTKAHRFLAELKGAAATIPNQVILIDTLGLQEAKDSSEIEAIITTHDDLFRAGLIDETKADFVTAYLADPPIPGRLSTVQKIRRGPRWQRKNR